MTKPVNVTQLDLDGAKRPEIEEMAIVGHSVGAVGVAAWVHDYAPPIRAMVLATPAFRVKLYVPLAMPALTTMPAENGRNSRPEVRGE